MELTVEKKEELLKCIDKNIKCFSLSGKVFNCKVVNVYDADTCKVVFYLNNELVKYTIRLKGIDTPEIRPPSSDKNRKIQIREAKRSRNRLIQLSTDCNLDLESDLSKNKIQNIINNNKKIIQIKCEEFDKYGRLLGSLYCESNESNESKESNESNESNVSLNNILIKEGYAYEYEGGTKRKFDYSKYLKEYIDENIENKKD